MKKLHKLTYEIVAIWVLRRCIKQRDYYDFENWITEALARMQISDFMSSFEGQQSYVGEMRDASWAEKNPVKPLQVNGVHPDITT